jgi:UDPglucose 6-dehydrogenase
VNNISFIGLGKLGLPLALLMAKNNKVIAIDRNVKALELLRSGISHIKETDIQLLFDSVKESIQFTADYSLVINTDISVILVNTPSDKHGNFSNQYIIEALTEICNNIRGKKSFHSFIISSTVMPLSLENEFIPLIEKLLNTKVNKGFDICYVPDFVALGSVIHDFCNPEFVVVGESNQKIGEIVSGIYQSFLRSNVPFCYMSLTEAEIAKVSLNAYITMKLSFVNFLGMLCSKIENVDVNKITSTIGKDRRISSYYFKSGTPFGGFCFPRDTTAFIKFADKLDMSATQMVATKDINNMLFQYILEKVLSYRKDAISILGVTFKPNSIEIEESLGWFLLTELTKRGIEVHVYDPLLKIDNITNVIYHMDLKECILSTSLCVITLMHNEFRKIEDSWAMVDKSVILDCWGFLNQKFDKFVYHKLYEYNS